MTDPAPPHRSARHWPIFVAIFVVSFLPLLFLKVDEAGQLASALALPLSVLLAALTTVSIGHGHGQVTGPPLPWKRLLVIGSAVVALVGGSAVAYYFWENSQDIAVELTGPSGSSHWKDGSSTVMSVPGPAGRRDHLTIAVSLKNINNTGDCERTATLDFTPILDDQPKDPVTGRAPREEVELSVAGATRDVKVLIAIHYDEGNRDCEVDLFVDKAVLHD